MLSIIVIVIFLALYLLNRQQSSVWGILLLMSLLLLVNKSIFPNTFDSPLYYVRTFIVFIAALYLIKINTFHSIYQACICVLTLILFMALHYDMVAGSNLVYDKYEGFIYGIMVSRFMGIIIITLEKLRTNSSHNTTDSDNNFSCMFKGRIK